MSGLDRDEDGEFNQKVTDEQIVDAIASNPAPVVTAAELAEQLPIGRRAVRERLLTLEERNIVDRKDAGARAVVWWLVEHSQPTPDREAESLADRLGGFGMLEGEAGEEFAAAVKGARDEFDEDMGERTDALFGE